MFYIHFNYVLYLPKAHALFVRVIISVKYRRELEAVTLAWSLNHVTTTLKPFQIDEPLIAPIPSSSLKRKGAGRGKRKERITNLPSLS